MYLGPGNMVEETDSSAVPTGTGAEKIHIGLSTVDSFSSLHLCQGSWFHGARHSSDVKSKKHGKKGHAQS